MTDASNREFDLVAACCRPPRDPARAAAVQVAAGADPDWAHVLRIARRHRVEPLVLDGLRNAGIALPAAASALAERVAAGARDRLALTAETLRLDGLFEAAGIDRLHFKGATLDRLAYGRAGFKQSRDIDVLIDARDLDRAEALMADQGYVRDYPSPELAAQVQADSARRRVFMRREKETVWRRGKLVVEIHWRLATSLYLLPGIDVSAPRQSVELMPGRRVATLAPPELYAYLALHGSYHAWFRLKWLADFVALVAELPPADLAELHRRAVALRVGRCSAQALLLGEQVLGLALPSERAAQLRSDPAVRGMMAFARSVFTAPVAPGEVELLRPHRGRLLRSQWLSSTHWRYRIELAAGAWRRLQDMVRAPFRR